ncbi:hepatocyte nuclear factor 6 [Corvus kubaryi]|uniref:hepatocyte nuclear factor 6 n=1 Tax=Corvus kubaryi TaxID=68294 RepID=UPI001C058B75|nr:hepatocyte nuclear factor 6 [Corvus kubaryi]
MNAQLAMENIGDLHGVSHEPVPAAADLMSGSPHHRSAVAHRGSHLPAHPRSMGMASILDGGDYHHHHRPPEHALTGPLHPTMTMACETPPGMSMSSTYTTLTPLQPLPPISTVSDKFPHHHHHHHHHHHPHQRIPGNVSGSFTLMRDERGLASMNNLYTPYHKDVTGMGQSLSPLSGSGLGSIHNSQQGLPHYAHPSATMPTEKMLTPNGFEAHHPAMLARHGDQHLTPTSAGMVPINGIPHHPHAHLNAQSHGQILGSAREQNPSVTGSQVNSGSNSGQMEEINTKEVAQRITTELKRYSIPQAIFAQRVLCRSQGTLSDLLRNPKPWSKLKSGRETFRRMWKWLQEPEFQRMSALRLAGEPAAGWSGHGSGRTGPRALAGRPSPCLSLKSSTDPPLRHPISLPSPLPLRARRTGTVRFLCAALRQSRAEARAAQCGVPALPVPRPGRTRQALLPPAERCPALPVTGRRRKPHRPAATLPGARRARRKLLNWRLNRARPGPRTGCGGAPVTRRREESVRLLCVGGGGLGSQGDSGPASR